MVVFPENATLMKMLPSFSSHTSSPSFPLGLWALQMLHSCLCLQTIFTSSTSLLAIRHQNKLHDRIYQISWRSSSLFFNMWAILTKRMMITSDTSHNSPAWCFSLDQRATKILISFLLMIVKVTANSSLMYKQKYFRKYQP